jgi:hypothetical protein
MFYLGHLQALRDGFASLDPAPTREDSAPARKTGGEQSGWVSHSRQLQSSRNPSQHSTASRLSGACRYGLRQEG